MDAVIVTPAPAGSRHGNRNTALRWARQLRALGHTVSVDVAWNGRPHDLMIALHARRSHAAMRAWKEAHPAKPLVCVLTGTDLYRDIRRDADARESLDLADRLIVLQEQALDELDAHHRAKAEVIFQSVRRIARRPVRRQTCLFTVIGHLRDEKDPFCAARALSHVDCAVEVVHLGGALSDDMQREAERWMSAEPRYRWLGEVPRARALEWLARSDAMVISSRMEGGAHVVSEAIAAGVPVLASDIPGNLGLLGRDYPAVYPVADERALATLMQRLATDDSYAETLARLVQARRPLVDPATERARLAQLLGSLVR
jgi:putative glycosyltransferase (TIGR04348 family)